MSTRRPAALPADLTSFVGRRAELTSVGRTLQTARMLTLTGIGGVGKTRLVVRAARSLQRRFPGGVAFAELAPVQEPQLVLPVLAEALGLPDTASGPRLEALLAYLRQRHVLLVVDNCEHLHPAVAHLVCHLLRGAPQLRILATSRRRLDVPGEVVLAVEPLPLPPPDVPMPAEAVAAHPAMELLVDRAWPSPASPSPGRTRPTSCGSATSSRASPWRSSSRSSG